MFLGAITQQFTHLTRDVGVCFKRKPETVANFSRIKGSFHMSRTKARGREEKKARRWITGGRGGTASHWPLPWQPAMAAAGKHISHQLTAQWRATPRSLTAKHNLNMIGRATVASLATTW